MQRWFRRLTPLLSLALAGSMLTPQLSLGCTLVLGTGGTLGPNMSGTEMSTEGQGGVTGSLTVASLTPSTITVEAPTYSAPISGTAEVAYSGISGLNGVNQPYTNQRTSFTVSGISILNPALVLVRNRIRALGGLATGDYSTITVVTCN